MAATMGAATSTTSSANSVSSFNVAVVLVEASTMRTFDGSLCREITPAGWYCRWYLLFRQIIAAFCVITVYTTKSIQYLNLNVPGVQPKLMGVVTTGTVSTIVLFLIG